MRLIPALSVTCQLLEMQLLAHGEFLAPRLASSTRDSEPVRMRGMQQLLSTWHEPPCTQAHACLGLLLGVDVLGQHEPLQRQALGHGRRRVPAWLCF